jgi:hypothetical protein
MADEDQSDDGALHGLFQGEPLPQIIDHLVMLRRLAQVRGAVPPELRARAQELADDPLFSQRDHPVIQRILAAP